MDPGRLLPSETGRSVSPLFVIEVPKPFSKDDPTCRYKSQQRPSAPDDPCGARHPQVRLLFTMSSFGGAIQPPGCHSRASIGALSCQFLSVRKCSHKAAEGLKGTIKGPRALCSWICSKTLGTKIIGGTNKPNTSPQFSVKASTPVEPSFQNLEKRTGSFTL